MQVKWRLPQWLPTVLVSLGILWLTLAPRPTGGFGVRLFPHQDKVSHAVMFGALAWCICYDSRRAKHSVRPIVAALIAIIAGGVIELAQESLRMGRSAEWLDWGADSLGAVLAAVAWRFRKKPNT